MSESSSQNSSTQPTVSVILNTYNRLDYLAEAIDSILQQSYQDFELLIVDDCSSNPKVLQCARHYAEQDERIRVIEQTQNGGLANGRNVGLHNARGQYIALMDDDDVSLPERLAKQVSFLIEHPQYAAVGCPRCYSQVDQQDSDQHPFLNWDICYSASPMQPWCGGATSASAMFRRDALLAVGAWRKWFLSAEDFDISLRLNEKYPLAVLGGEALYYYRTGSGNQMSAMTECWQYALAAIISAHLRRSDNADPVNDSASVDDILALISSNQLADDAYFFIAVNTASQIRIELRSGNTKTAWQIFKWFYKSIKLKSKIVILKRACMKFQERCLRNIQRRVRSKK